MAYEIFVSYRRSDAAGHARALHEYLEQRFDHAAIFFDRESIEAGDNFPERLRAAVSECKVLLALIGLDWLEARNKDGTRRLHDPKDFVRQEIALALAQSKKVIPVLFDDAPVPPASELPELIKPLTEVIDAFTLRGKNLEYRTQRQELVRLIAGVSGVTPPRSEPRSADSSASTLRPIFLPYLCNRSAQECEVRATVRSYLDGRCRRPLVLIVHGASDERHDAFVHRLERYSLPRILESCGMRQRPRFVHCNRALPAGAPAAGFAAELRAQLIEELQARYVDDDRAFAEQLEREEPSGVLGVFSWLSSECARDPQGALQRVFDYWAQFPDLRAPSALGGAILTLKYDHPANGARGFLRRWLSSGSSEAEQLEQAVESSKLRFGADARVCWRVLPKLEPVRWSDLTRWAEEARQRVERLRLPEEHLAKVLGGNESMPMAAVLRQLEELVPDA